MSTYAHRRAAAVRVTIDECCTRVRARVDAIGNNGDEPLMFLFGDLNTRLLAAHVLQVRVCTCAHRSRCAACGHIEWQPSMRASECRRCVSNCAAG
jgi:hypothetical protein